ncbi:hypothetical protein B9G55_01395 [Saccharibacillus sp. O16]|nr:hypothetical protein B9G55_01395 [Saccharibacillus sp. O16]
MARYSVEQAREMRDAWLAAEKAVTTGQSYSIAGRSLTRASMGDIRTQLAYWNRMLDEAQRALLGKRSPGRQRRYVPYD